MNQSTLLKLPGVLIIALVISLSMSYGLSMLIPSDQPILLDYFPLYTNIVEYVSVVLGGVLAVILFEFLVKKDVYRNTRIATALAVFGLMTPLTLGMGIFLKLSMVINIVATVGFETIIFFTIVALLHER